MMNPAKRYTFINHEIHIFSKIRINPLMFFRNSLPRFAACPFDVSEWIYIFDAEILHNILIRE